MVALLGEWHRLTFSGIWQSWIRFVPAVSKSVYTKRNDTVPMYSTSPGPTSPVPCHSLTTRSSQVWRFPPLTSVTQKAGTQLKRNEAVMINKLVVWKGSERVCWTGTLHRDWLKSLAAGIQMRLEDAWLQASVAVSMKSSLFWDVTEHRLLVSCWRFGTPYRLRIQGSS